MEIIAFLAVGALLATVVVLVMGISTFAEGHDDVQDLIANNRLMRRRVEIQAFAIALVLFGLIVAHFWHF